MLTFITNRRRERCAATKNSTGHTRVRGQADPGSGAINYSEAEAPSADYTSSTVGAVRSPRGLLSLFEQNITRS